MPTVRPRSDRAPSGLTLALLVVLATSPLVAEEWPYWRGPRSNNVSEETSLPSRWTRGGENTIWRAEWNGQGHHEVPPHTNKQLVDMLRRQPQTVLSSVLEFSVHERNSG
jgi:hypothetical protein